MSGSAGQQSQLEENISKDVSSEYTSNLGAAYEVTATGAKEAYRWSQQCLLSRLLHPIINYPAAGISGPGPLQTIKPYRYLTTFSTKKGDTGDFLNKLYMSGDNSDFVNINTFDRAHMLWSLDIYKVLYTEKKQNDGTVEYTHLADIPLIFEKMAKDDIEKYRAGKSVQYQRKTDNKNEIKGGLKEKFKGRPQTGYGVQSFSWTYKGGNPETVRNDIEATLVLEFQNFNQLSRTHEYLYYPDRPERSSLLPNSAESISYSLLDLLGYGPSSPKHDAGKEDLYHSSLYEIKAVVAWNANSKASVASKIKAQKTTLFLTLTDHDFSISQLGTFTLTLTYRARLEGSTSQMRTNVVYNTQLN